MYQIRLSKGLSGILKIEEPRFVSGLFILSIQYKGWVELVRHAILPV
jgi:hypothetical protein